MNEVYPLFSQPVFVSHNHVGIDYSDELRFCNQLEYVQNKGGNYASTETNILNCPEFATIKKLIIDAINHYAKGIMCWSENELYITQSWVNVNPKDTQHLMHYHFNSILSGVFYLQVSENDSITFYNDAKPLLDFRKTSYNIWNSETWEIPVKSGMVVLFPSQLTHSVKTHDTNIERVSIAFNTFVKGDLGSKENLTLLRL